MRIEPAEPHWQKLGGLIAQRLGLHFPDARCADLRRGFEQAMQEFGYDDPVACVDWLASTPPNCSQEKVLAKYFTVGETYFFREPETLQALADTVLPELIRRRRGRDQRLRIWSAACCTGEEAYSLAILLHRLLPDLADWGVSIIATDINPQALARAERGIYSNWSFRGFPAWQKSRYFTQRAEGDYALVPEIKKLVVFQHLNLATAAYPLQAIGLVDIDIILCRNVLMYFTPVAAQQVIDNMHRTLADGGWLAVSPSEAGGAVFQQFRTVNYPGTILFQKKTAPLPLPQPARPSSESGSALGMVTQASATSPTSAAASSAVFSNHATRRTASQEPEQDSDLQRLARRARALADIGHHTEALICCDQWTGADRLNPAGYYLRAVILQEQGRLEQARMALQSALYLDQDFVLAHFALGCLARRCGRDAQSRRHFANVQQLLRRRQPDAPLAGADGLCARRLAEIVASLVQDGAVA
jgi:chemotaxis protein methyltransferase CheR